MAPLLDLPGVRAAADEARAAVDRVHQHPANRRGWPATAAEASMRAARASAALDGADVRLPLGHGVADPVLAGAVRIADAIGTLLATWQRAPLQALARLHVLAAADLVPADRLGRPVGRPDVAARLDGLAGLVAGGSQAAAVVLAAVVHGELLALRPFGSADGIVARAAARLTTVSRGLDPRMVGVPEVGHLERRAEYASTLAAYAGGTPDGVASWLRHCCSAIALGAQEGLAVCEALLRG